eukprot:351015-Chlamydomonas_euryale.AAC.2
MHAMRACEAVVVSPSMHSCISCFDHALVWMLTLVSVCLDPLAWAVPAMRAICMHAVDRTSAAAASRSRGIRAAQEGQITSAPVFTPFPFDSSLHTRRMPCVMHARRYAVACVTHAGGHADHGEPFLSFA